MSAIAVAAATPDEPRWCDEDLAYAWRLALQAGHQGACADEVAWWAGFHAGRRYALAKVGELARVWRPVARRTEAQRVAERVAWMDKAAREHPARAGRPFREYLGGPVDWETGEAVGTGVATVSSRRATA